jgi:hypothetical protein
MVKLRIFMPPKKLFFLIFNTFFISKIDKPIEFKCLITEGDKAYWENVPNRFLTIKASKQLIFLTFGTIEMHV